MNAKKVVDRCDFQPGDIVDGKYVVTKLLGEGSFGVVYRVEGRQGGEYALKLLRLWEVPAEIRQQLMDRFEMEFRTGQIECDNLVRSLAYGSVGGNPYIVMEFCPGGDLEPLLGKPDGRTVQVCLDILTGLNALHERGKVHRDLKPENVLFKRNGHAALTDFGISGDRTHRMTQRNIFGRPDQIFGTYAYMPPEQVARARGGATVLPTTDIFSFGVVLYQLLTNQLPFGRMESHEDLAQYLKRGKEGRWERDALSHVANGRQWADVIEGCLNPDFSKRLQNVREVMRMLQQMASGAYSSQLQPVLSPPPVYLPQPQSRGFLLRVLQGEEHGRTYDLTQMSRLGKRVLTIGRQPGNDIHVRSDYSDFMSRYHCTLELVPPAQWAVRDGQWHRETKQWITSTNGTFVNSVHATADGYYLEPGDIIAMGDVTLRFENY